MFEQLFRLQRIHVSMLETYRLATLILFLAVVFMPGCGQTTADTDSLIVENPFDPSAQGRGVPVAFSLDGTFGADDEPTDAILDNVRDAAVDVDGNVYLLDGQNRIVAFDEQGALLWQMAAQGEGPGELNRPWGMEMGPDERLYVNNQSATRIDVYDLNGAHVRAISPESFGINRFSVVGFPNDTTAVGVAFQSGTLGVRIGVVDVGEQWRMRNEIVIDQSEGIDMPDGMSGSPSVDLLDGQLAVSNVTRYEISLLSLTGDTLRVIRREVDDYTRPGFHSSGNTISMRMFSNTSTPLKLPGGLRIIQASWPTNVDDPDAYTASDNPPEIEYHRSLDLYDSNWNLIYSISEDEYEDLQLGRPQFVDGEGYLYTSRSVPWPRLDRYSVESVTQ